MILPADKGHASIVLDDNYHDKMASLTDKGPCQAIGKDLRNSMSTVKLKASKKSNSLDYQT